METISTFDRLKLSSDICIKTRGYSRGWKAKKTTVRSSIRYIETSMFLLTERSHRYDVQVRYFDISKDIIDTISNANYCTTPVLFHPCRRANCFLSINARVSAQPSCMRGLMWCCMPRGCRATPLIVERALVFGNFSRAGREVKVDNTERQWRRFWKGLVKRERAFRQ